MEGGKNGGPTTIIIPRAASSDYSLIFPQPEEGDTSPHSQLSSTADPLLKTSFFVCFLEEGRFAKQLKVIQSELFH